jgi:hypothetical protein
MAVKPDKKMLQDQHLALCPPGTLTVQVTTELGAVKYKSLAELVDTDEINLRPDGVPIVTRKPSGRPPGPSKQTVLRPTTPGVQALVKSKTEFMKADPVFQAAQEDPDNPDVLHQVVLGLTQEAASLAFERAEAERNGLETSNISIRRVNALKAVGDTWLKRKEQLSSVSLDIGSPPFRVFLKELSSTFKDAMEASGLRPELIETIFSKVGKAMDDDWSSAVRAKMKSASNS